MRASLHRLDGIFGVAVGPRIDRHGIGFGLGERDVEVLVQRVAAEPVGQGLPLDRPAHQADDLEAVVAVVGAGVRLAHVAQPDDQYAYLPGHAALLNSWQEKRGRRTGRPRRCV
jgi:hypothetical protein